MSLLLALALGACGDETDGDGGSPEASEPESPTEITVTERQKGGSTGLEVGHVLRIELPANPTTGYAWTLAEVDTDVLKPPPEEEYLPPQTDAMGAGGISIWRFEAVGPGTTTLRLVYRRPWEEEAPPAETFDFTVAVE